MKHSAAITVVYSELATALDAQAQAQVKDRAASAPDRLNVASDAYRRTVRYYGWRNGIAHGATLATGIDVPTIIGDLYRIAGELRA